MALMLLKVETKQQRQKNIFITNLKCKIMDCDVKPRNKPNSTQMRTDGQKFEVCIKIKKTTICNRLQQRVNINKGLSYTGDMK